jgi:hypothetical protein
MNAQALNLIGKKIQKVETTKRGVVANVRDGSHFLPGMTCIDFVDGYSGLYSEKDIAQLLKNGTHFHNCD